MNKKFWVAKIVAKIVGFIIIAFIITTLLSFIVMALWNNILTVVLHVSAVTFWQALGILVLSKILFGGFKGKGRWGHRNEKWRREREEMHEKWHTMTPEEREKIKQEWRNRCRVWKKPDTEQNAGAE